MRKRWRKLILTKASFLAFGRLLALLLCLCLALFSSVPASAYEISNLEIINGVRTRPFFNWQSNVNGNLHNTAIQGWVVQSNYSEGYFDAYLRGGSATATYELVNPSIFEVFVITNNLEYRGFGQSDFTTRGLGCEVVSQHEPYTVWSCLYHNTDSRANGYLYISAYWKRLNSAYNTEITIGGFTQYKYSGDIASLLAQIKDDTAGIRDDVWNIRQTINSLNSNVSTIQSDIARIKQLTDWTNTDVFAIRGDVSDIKDSLDSQSSQDATDRTNMQNQQTSIDSSASSSEQQAQTAGTTLLGAFSAFVGALTNASPSNCVIDMDLGNLDLGNVDLCTLSPPQPIPTIASIMLIAFFVPLSIATATKMINLFRSFSG